MPTESHAPVKFGIECSCRLEHELMMAAVQRTSAFSARSFELVLSHKHCNRHLVVSTGTYRAQN